MLIFDHVTRRAKRAQTAPAMHPALELWQNRRHRTADGRYCADVRLLDPDDFTMTISEWAAMPGMPHHMTIARALDRGILPGICKTRRRHWYVRPVDAAHPLDLMAWEHVTRGGSWGTEWRQGDRRELVSVPRKLHPINKHRCSVPPD